MTEVLKWHTVPMYLNILKNKDDHRPKERKWRGIIINIYSANTDRRAGRDHILILKFILKK